MADMKDMNMEELDNVSGGGKGIQMIGGSGPDNGGQGATQAYSAGGQQWKTVSGLQTGYLALRTKPAYDASNEIGQLYNGEQVMIKGGIATTGNDYDPTYTYVYSPKLQREGWVNSRFIV